MKMSMLKRTKHVAEYPSDRTLIHDQPLEGPLPTCSQQLIHLKLNNKILCLEDISKLCNLCSKLDFALYD